MRLRRFAPFFAVAVILLSELVAQTSNQKVRAQRVAHEQEWLEEYFRFVAIPNVPADRAKVRRNAELVEIPACAARMTMP